MFIKNKIIVNRRLFYEVLQRKSRILPPLWNDRPQVHVLPLHHWTFKPHTSKCFFGTSSLLTDDHPRSLPPLSSQTPKRFFRNEAHFVLFLFLFLVCCFVVVLFVLLLFCFCFVLICCFVLFCFVCSKETHVVQQQTSISEERKEKERELTQISKKLGATTRETFPQS